MKEVEAKTHKMNEDSVDYLVSGTLGAVFSLGTIFNTEIFFDLGKAFLVGAIGAVGGLTAKWVWKRVKKKFFK